MAFYNLSSLSAGAPALTGVAGSLITVLDWLLVTTMGWTKPYSATNKAAYQQPAGTNGFVLLVDDTNASYGLMRAYESMSSITTGVNPFPNTSQLSGGTKLYRSSTSSAVARPWRFVSNGKLFHFLFDQNGTIPSGVNAWTGTTSVFTFGDFVSYKPGDVYNTVLIGDTDNYVGSPSYCAAAQITILSSSSTPGTYVARPHTQTGLSIGANRQVDFSLGGSYAGSTYSPAQAFPSPVHGGIDLGRVYIGDPGVCRRGYLPGSWFWGHSVPTVTSAGVQSGDTFSGGEGTELAGKTFEWYRIGPVNNQAAFVLETSNWGV